MNGQALAQAQEMIRDAEQSRSERVDLGGLGLETVPEAIGRLTHLTHLSLRGNYLSELPPVIGRLVCLTQLSLADNQLTDLPAEVGHLARLAHLNLKNNRLGDIPAVLLQMDRLESLHLAGNPLALPGELINRWNRPAEILAFVRREIARREASRPPSLNALVSRYFDPEALGRLWQELAVSIPPPQGGDHDQAAANFVDFHRQAGLDADLRDLLQILVPHIDWQRTDDPVT